MTETMVGRLDIGTRVRIADGCHKAGRCGSVVSREVFVGQWWCPVLWDDAEDPGFHKSSCLEPLDGLTAEDWGEMLHALTSRARDVRDDDCDTPEMSGDWRRHLQSIAGKIGGRELGQPCGLTSDDWREIYYALDSLSLGDIQGEGPAGGPRVHPRTIMGKIGPDGQDLASRHIHQAIGMEEVLARLYTDGSEGRIRCAVRGLCEKLDRSGGLLGRVRDQASKLGGKGWMKETSR